MPAPCVALAASTLVGNSSANRTPYATASATMFQTSHRPGLAMRDAPSLQTLEMASGLGGAIGRASCRLATTNRAKTSSLRPARSSVIEDVCSNLLELALGPARDPSADETHVTGPV